MYNENERRKIMKTIEGFVTNHNGLTSRLSVELVEQANKFTSNITIHVLDEQADLKSIMNVMALVVPYGEVFTIIIDGEDEEEAAKKFASFLQELKLVK